MLGRKSSQMFTLLMVRVRIRCWIVVIATTIHCMVCLLLPSLLIRFPSTIVPVFGLWSPPFVVIFLVVVVFPFFRSICHAGSSSISGWVVVVIILIHCGSGVHAVIYHAVGLVCSWRRRLGIRGSVLRRRLRWRRWRRWWWHPRIHERNRICRHAVVSRRIRWVIHWMWWVRHVWRCSGAFRMVP